MALGENDHPTYSAEVQGGAQPGDSAADDEKICFERTPRHRYRGWVGGEGGSDNICFVFIPNGKSPCALRKRIEFVPTHCNRAWPRCRIPMSLASRFHVPCQWMKTSISSFSITTRSILNSRGMVEKASKSMSTCRCSSSS